MNSVKIAEGGRIYIPEIKEEKVTHTYNGKVGCACGCLGKYSYKQEGREEQSKRRGYEVSDDEIRPKSICATVKKINAALRGEFEVDVLIVDEEFVAIDVAGRSYTAYFN